jgi:UDP-N-acetylmuramoyl-tripeptide--D-alanyl-D-alanine ligase
LTEIADPDVGVITNVGVAHLEGLGDLEGVAKAKVELVEKISSKGLIVLNGDDKLLMETAAPYQRETVTFGLEKKNDVSGARVQNLGREGVSFHVQYQGRSWAIRLGIPGLHNVINALAAAAVGLCLNEPPEYIVEGLGCFAGVKGRFMLVSLPGDIILVDDTYNANPSSLKAALDSVRALADRGDRIIVGLGEMMELGDAAAPAHQEAGRMVAEIGARYFLIMGEHANEMVKGAVESGLHRSKVEVVKSHNEMLRRIREEMRQGDLIFLKGSREMSLEKVADGLKDIYH